MPIEAPTAVAALPSTVMTRDGIQLPLSHWPVSGHDLPKGVVCVVHGLGEHMGRYQPLARFLNHHGWAVAGHDHRGHGRAPGPRGALAHDDDLLHDLTATIDALREAYPGLPLALLGHSLGGLVVARFVAALADPIEDASWRRPIDLCVLSSPALDIGLNGLQRLMLSTVGRLTPDIAVASGLRAEWVCSDASVVKDYVDDPLVHDRITGRLTRFMLEGGEVVHERAPHWLVPTLVLYAGADRCVRPQGSARFAAALPPGLGRAHAYEHMFHEIFLEPDRARVFTDLHAWLQEAVHTRRQTI